MSRKKGKVGYCNPPEEHRFPKGKSGNPKGRPKGTRNFETILKRELERPVTVTDNGIRRAIPKRDIMTRMVVDKAVKGDLKAFQTLHKMENSFDPGVRADQGEGDGFQDSELPDEIYEDALKALIQRRMEGQS